MQIEYNGKLYDVEIVNAAGQEEYTIPVSTTHYKNEIHIGIIRKFFIFPFSIYPV